MKKSTPRRIWDLSPIQGEPGAWHKRLYNAILVSWLTVPPRLNPVFQKYDPPLYFVTFNTQHRQKLLANAEVHVQLIEFARKGQSRGIAIGRYVIMPDHIHLFVRGNCDFVLTQWMRLLKRNLSKAISTTSLHWQKGFFDHLVRHSESYSEKWHYVLQNPVRAGLASDAEDWPYQGELVRLEAL